MDGKTATIWTTGTDKVKIMARPSADCNEYWHIPNWTQVFVVESVDEWTKVLIGTSICYVQSKYILFGSDLHADELESQIQE